MDIIVTSHAADRIAQRNVDPAHIAQCLQHGTTQPSREGRRRLAWAVPGTGSRIMVVLGRETDKHVICSAFYRGGSLDTGR